MILMVWLLACPPQAECVDNGQCDERQACLGGTCFDVRCTEGSHCPIEQRCTSRYECVPGCSVDGDCLTGYVCEAGTCIEPPCESTVVDCSFGEYCVDGACVPVEGICETCEGGCPDGLECVTRRGEVCEQDSECEVDQTCALFAMPNVPPCTPDTICPNNATCVDAQCLQRACISSVCSMTCDEQAEVSTCCPAGFLCEGGNVCYAECAYIQEQGY